MAVGLLIGPYARQLVPSFDSKGQPTIRLKFWFVVMADGIKPKRYEALIGKGDDELKLRSRPLENFHAYRVPDDLSAFSRAPLHKGDTLSSAALAMLRGEDIADVTRMRLLGTAPTRQAWHQTENDPCTSKQPLLI